MRALGRFESSESVMSRIGEKPINVPDGVTVRLDNGTAHATGPKGSARVAWPAFTRPEFDASSRSVRVVRTSDSKQGRANHGLARSLLANLVRGVSEGFSKRLLIYGTGYNCKLVGRTLHLNVGFGGRNRGKGSQFELPVPDGLDVVVETPAARGDSDPARLVIAGIDKQRVGQFAAEVRSLRITEPYKGKGIRYEDEHVRRKQGKALAGAG